MIERQTDLVMPGGHSIAVRVFGSGRPVMLVHGFPLDSTIWRKQFDALAAEGFQVIAPDLRGFGNSSPIVGPMTMADFAEDLEHVRQVLAADQKLVLVGLSMGGYVAFEYWKRHAGYLSKLVLVDTRPYADTTEARQARYAMAERALQEGTWQAASPMLGKLLSVQTLEHDTETTEWLKAMMSQVRPKTLAAAQHAMAERHDFSSELEDMSIPTLVIVGEHDSIAPPSEAQSWSAQMPTAELVIIPASGHLPQIENSRPFNEALLKFL
ncbi:MAG: alpha/beta fold hydrolase [Aureliella sp.]